MEIATAPRHPAPTPWGRSVLLVVLFGPVTLLVLLPVGLGLDRYVMTGDSMSGSVARGSIAFERVVPVSDLHVGDVITFAAPGTVTGPEAPGQGAMVTRRIVAVQPEGIRTRGEATASVDPWLLRPDRPTLSRVAFTVPWIGWAYPLLVHPQGWALTIASAIALVLLTGWRLRPSQATLQPSAGAETAVASAAAATPRAEP